MRSWVFWFGTTAAALGAAGAALAQQAEPESPEIRIEPVLDFVSDYRFRGVSLNGRDPALQPGITVSHASGLHAGAWGSNIAENPDADIEVDITAGFSFTRGGWTVDLGGVYYLYPGASGANYAELLVSAERAIGDSTIGLLAAYAPSQRGTGHADNLYLAISGTTPIAGPVSASAGFGWEHGAFGNDKLDWSLGLDLDLGKGFGAGVSYVDTRRASAGNNGEPGAVVKFSKTL